MTNAGGPCEHERLVKTTGHAGSVLVCCPDCEDFTVIFADEIAAGELRHGAWSEDLAHAALGRRFEVDEEG